MVTVVDPGGTPIPVYNRSGETIVQVSGGSPANPTPIPSFSGVTVAVTTHSASGDHYRLPSGAEVGDVAEICSADGVNQDVVAPAGETIRGQGSIALAPMGGSGRFRKFSSTQWG